MEAQGLQERFASLSRLKMLTSLQIHDGTGIFTDVKIRAEALLTPSDCWICVTSLAACGA
jgi:hypothetical protein